MVGRLSPSAHLRRGVALASVAAVVGAACAPSVSPAPPAATVGRADAPEVASASGEPIKIGYVWGVTAAIAESFDPPRRRPGPTSMI
jgi:hypothetical protein